MYFLLFSIRIWNSSASQMVMCIHNTEGSCQPAETWGPEILHFSQAPPSTWCWCHPMSIKNSEDMVVVVKYLLTQLLSTQMGSL